MRGYAWETNTIFVRPPLYLAVDNMSGAPCGNVHVHSISACILNGGHALNIRVDCTHTRAKVIDFAYPFPSPPY